MLPLISSHAGGRAAVTCEYRCGNACSHPAPNISDNAYFADIVARTASRRGVLRAGAMLGLTAGAVATLGATVLRSGTASGATPAARGTDFTPVAPNAEDAVLVPEGYEQNVVIRWGDPVVPGAPEFDFANQTAEAQAGQFGFNNDFCGLVPVPGRDDAWLMVSNFEYTSEEFMFHGYDPASPTEEQAKIAWESHGMSVVLVERAPGGGLVAKVDPTYNRRITLASTKFDVRGPARGSDYLKTSADPSGTTVIGTQNNCAGGVTPWGTILSGEENFNQYFANADTADPRVKRYGLAAGPSTRKWERFDRRYDLSKEPNEANRFGYIVERPAGPGVHAGQAHRAWPVQARGRQCDRRRGRPRGRVHGRRRAVRLHVQVRLRRQGQTGHHPPGARAQQEAAHRGDALRREVQRRQPGGGDRRHRQAAVRR